MNITKTQELEVALIRLLTGIKKTNFKGCVWYEGLLYDAMEEAVEVLK